MYFRPYVKPSLGQCGIHAHGQHILIAVIQKVGHVESKWGVSAEFFADVMPIEHYHRVPEYAVKFHGDASSCVFGGNIEYTAIPPNTCFRKITADWFCAMIGKFVVARRFAIFVENRWPFFKRKLHSPVMRQVNTLPGAIVKIGSRDSRKSARLSIRGLTVLRAKSEILRGIIRVAEVEAPAEIQQQTRTRRFGHAAGPRR